MTTDKLRRRSSSAFQAYQCTAEQQGCPGLACESAASGAKLVPSLTVSLVQTYQRCSPAFRYSSKLAPRRLLTKPADPASNSGWDNATHDLIVAVGDEFVSTLGTRYVVRDLLGQGTFGQVFKCVCVDDGEEDSGAIAIKVVKNQAAYYHQARVEIGVLQFLNTRADPGDRHHIVRLKDFFLFRNHLCLVFELLSLNLYELIRHNKFRGLSLSLVRVFISQILDAMVVLRDSRIIHCDLKPENVLLKNVESGEVKVIDFGSACFESRTVYSYIQSRFYRSPEVVLGYPYAMSIDMWSLGCVAAELFLGLPLFPGACEHDLLGRIIGTLGPLPDFLLTKGKNARKFFAVEEEVVRDALSGEQLLRQRFLLRTRQQYEELTGQPAPAGKQYFQHSALADIISAYPFRSGLSDEDVSRERRLRECFTDFLLGVLDVNPSTRWTPRQASQHPFITGERFTGPFQPLPDPSVSPAVNTPAAISSRPGSSLGTPQQLAQHAQQHAAPAPVHTPGMTIPLAPTAARQHQPAAMAASAEQQAAAVAAASPWAAAAAHAAAVAAVQARYGSLPHGSLQQPYSAAHSLQAIVGPGQPGGMAQMTDGLGMAAMQATPPGAQSMSSSYVPLLSPPSRSFRTQLRYADSSSSLLQQQQMASVDALHGVMPLLQTPKSVSQQQPFSPGSFQPGSFQPGSFQPGSFQPSSFQPSSISTYQAALAAAQAALQQQKQHAPHPAQQQAAVTSPLPGSSYKQQVFQQQHGFSPYKQHQQLAAAGAAAGGMPATSWGPASWQQPQQAQQQRFMPTSLTDTRTAAAAASAAAAAAAAAVGSLQTGAGLPAGMLQQQLLGSRVQQGAGAPLAATGGSRWPSMDGSSPGGTPPLGGKQSGEDIPNPADFDPLWSDELLEEEEQQGQQQADQAPHAKRQHLQAPPQQAQQAQQALQAHQREPSLTLSPLQQRLGSLQPPGHQPRDGLPQRRQPEQQQVAPFDAVMSSLGAPASLGASLGTNADPLALAAKCLPQLQQLQAQQQAQQPARQPARQFAQQAQQQQQQQQADQEAAAQQQHAVAQALQQVAQLSAQQQAQQQLLAAEQQAGVAEHQQVAQALQQVAQLSAQQQQQQQQQPADLAGFGSDANGDSMFAFQSPFRGAQQQQQADVANMLSAFGRVAAAAAAEAGCNSAASPDGNFAATTQAQQQQQLLLLHKSLSLGVQHSTTLTDGFANYSLQDAPSLASAAAVAAAAAAALSQQQPSSQQQSGQALEQQQQQQVLDMYAAAAATVVQQAQAAAQQQAAEQAQQQLFGMQDPGAGTPTRAALAQQAAAAGAAPSDSVSGMLWSPGAAPQLLQSALDAPPPAALLLGPGQQAMQPQVQYQLPQQQQPSAGLQPLQRQQGFEL